jgi:hypothetical protein
MLFVSDLKDVKFTGMYRATIVENQVIIEAQIERWGFEDWYQIGRYNIDTKEGKILLKGYKEFKWYKSLKALFNAIYKVDSNASMTDYNHIMLKIEAIKKLVA